MIIVALKEAQAIAKGTKCSQFLYSVSLSAPNVSIASYEHASKLDAVKMGLENQPYLMVFHEKQGRRHCHIVFSRIQAKTMTAINLPFYKNKMAELSKELFLSHGWQLPQGHIDKNLKNPLNFTLQEFQQAKKLDRDQRIIKQALNECWKISDDKKSFENAIHPYGFNLAKGDRRGFVLVDYNDQVLSLSRWLGIKNKELKCKLGEYNQLLSIDQVKERIDKALVAKINLYQDKVKNNFKNSFTLIKIEITNMLKRQKEQRQTLDEKIAQRREIEN